MEEKVVSQVTDIQGQAGLGAVSVTYPTSSLYLLIIQTLEGITIQILSLIIDNTDCQQLTSV